jgi:tetratricopeptide (TPR) repeat protein
VFTLTSASASAAAPEKETMMMMKTLAQPARGSKAARLPVVAALVAASLAIGSSMALAMGGGSSGGGDSSGGGAPRTDLTTCPKGKVWNTTTHKCLPQHAGVLPDKQLTEYAHALAKAERFEEALAVLDMLKNPETARALNYRGYATRKLGRTEEGIGYYLRSVALDPTYTQVREYLGEAYVTLGRFDLAQEQLAMIKKLCGSEACEAYEDLHDAISQKQPG